MQRLRPLAPSCHFPRTSLGEFIRCDWAVVYSAFWSSCVLDLVKFNLWCCYVSLGRICQFYSGSCEPEYTTLGATSHSLHSIIPRLCCDRLKFRMYLYQQGVTTLPSCYGLHRKKAVSVAMTALPSQVDALGDSMPDYLCCAQAVNFTLQI